MAAQPEPSARLWEVPRSEAAARPSAVVLPMQPATGRGGAVVTATSGERLGPARGLFLGLVLGLVLWAGLIRVVLGFLH